MKKFTQNMSKITQTFYSGDCEYLIYFSFNSSFYSTRFTLFFLQCLCVSFWLSIKRQKTI